MPIPKLNSCCCFFSVEMGAKILGYFETIAGLIGILCYLLVLAGVIHISEVPGKVDTFGTSNTVLALIGLIFVTLSGLLLLMGVYKRNPSYVKVSLVIRCVTVIFHLITVVVNIVALISGKHSQIATSILGTLLEIYFTLIVYSLYLDLKGGSVNTY